MEEKKQLLDYLEQNMKFFNVSKKIFDLLKKEKLNIDDYILLTPLLKQITDYALVANILEDEMDEVYEFYDDLGEILGICNSCDCLVNVLIEEKCDHPTIKNFINCLNGISLRTDIFSIAYSIVDNLLYPSDFGISEDEDEYYSDVKYMEKSDLELDEFIDLRNSISMINEPTCKLLDFLFKYILFSSKEKGLSDVGILNYLVSYSNMKIKIVMLISNYNCNITQYKKNDVLINLMSEENLCPTFEFDFGNIITSFSDMFISLEKLLEKEIITDKIIRIKEAYHLYQSYRFNYLRTLEDEKKLLNKRKKY